VSFHSFQRHGAGRLTPNHYRHHDFTSLGNHVTSVLSQNEELRANNAHLNRDLEVYKDGWTRIKSEKENLESIKREVERQLQHALEQLKVRDLTFIILSINNTIY